MSSENSWDDGPGQKADNDASGDALRQRYVERTLEKILRFQREPPVRAVDYLTFVLMLVILGAVLFRPMHATVDTAPLEKSLQEIQGKVDAIQQKQALLDKQLAVLRALQKQVASLKSQGVARPTPLPEVPSPVASRSPSPAASPSHSPSPVASRSPSPSPSARPSPTPSKSPAASKSPSPSSTVIKMPTPKPSSSASPDAAGQDRVHVLQPGESLWSVCQKYYGDARFLNALARYNGIDNPGRMRVGTEIKLPPIDKLKGRHTVHPDGATGTGRD